MGFLSAAFGGATLSDDLTPVLRGWSLPSGVAGRHAGLITVDNWIEDYVSLDRFELLCARLKGLEYDSNRANKSIERLRSRNC